MPLILPVFDGSLSQVFTSGKDANRSSYNDDDAGPFGTVPADEEAEPFVDDTEDKPLVRCKVCGAYLSSRNVTGACWCHAEKIENYDKLQEFYALYEKKDGITRQSVEIA